MVAEGAGMGLGMEVVLWGGGGGRGRGGSAVGDLERGMVAPTVAAFLLCE